MTTFPSCEAPLDLREYHGCCIFAPRHSGSHFDGLYYWETGRPFDHQGAGARAAKVLGLVQRRRRRRTELVVESSQRRSWAGVPAPGTPPPSVRTSRGEAQSGLSAPSGRGPRVPFASS